MFHLIAREKLLGSLTKNANHPARFSGVKSESFFYYGGLANQLFQARPF
jgi:hypothetical protein